MARSERKTTIRGEHGPEPAVPEGGYVVRTGMNYRVRTGEKRAEPGEVVSDLPARAVARLLQQGHIEPADTIEDEEAG